MFWADEIVAKLKNTTHHITDGKTPSGRIHVGSLRGVLIHEAINQALLEQKAKGTFRYIFDDIDPFDRTPTGLNTSKYEKYIGKPLIHVPSPDNSSETYASYFANEFVNVIAKLGIKPEILWQSKLYQQGKLDEAVSIALDNAEKIQDIYQKVSGSKKREQGWFPFQPICEQCGKIGTTKAVDWDGRKVTYDCLIDLVSWAKGCGHHGKISPFGGRGKLPWKVYWPARWYALKTTIEGEGKDLASKGGARDIANHIAKEVYHIDPPIDIPYEFFLFGGAKMSTSKGIGMSASDIIEILPPQPVRFLMLRSKPMQAINFDPTNPATIPKLLDEYQIASEAEGADLAKIFALSQIGTVLKPPKVRFSTLAQWVQMPNMDDEIRKEGLETWARYARIWVERFAPQSEKFAIQKELPSAAKEISAEQRKFLKRVAQELDKDWNAEDFQKNLFEWAKEVDISSKDAFAAIYAVLLGKNHGPKAAWFILSLDREFVKKRFNQI